MQTEAARGEWFVGVEPAGPSERSRPRVERARGELATGRAALAAVLALWLFGAGVLAAAVAIVPSVYTPLF
jgi:hypothetical protein